MLLLGFSNEQNEKAEQTFTKNIWFISLMKTEVLQKKNSK